MDRVIQRTTLIVGFGIVVCVLAGCAILFIWARGYENRVAPNVYVGNVSLSGMDESAVKRLLQNTADSIINNGIEVISRKEKWTLPLATLSSTNATEDVQFDINEATKQILEANHSKQKIADVFEIFKALFSKTTIRIPLQFNQSALDTHISNQFQNLEQQGKEAGFETEQTPLGWEVNITKEQIGSVINRQKLFENLQSQLESLNTTPIVIQWEDSEPKITSSIAKSSKNQVARALNLAPYTISYTKNNTVQKVWHLSAEQLSKMITPSSEKGRLEIASEPFGQWIDEIAKEIEQPALDAKFEIKDGRVSSFGKSQTGRQIERELTRDNLKKQINSIAFKNVELVIVETEPNAPLKDINDLGISELLGTGVSNYKGSPGNRIKNIANGVRLLNGVLIAPGETFSLINALKPFDETNGYLPELVIKGNEIKPELGGGLCQIGTTTFRTALNSGLPIAERSNHSLVVSYYNDPSNGNPGTDATIYDPAPDLKFTNDTGHHILFQTEMLTDVNELHFSFWGTSDGRKGSYSAPVVSEWFGVGEPKIIETLKLEPGKEECQSAHVGANASFTYTVVKPDGTINERIFESHYRPLPKICLLGVVEIKPEGKIYSDLPEAVDQTTDQIPTE